LVFGFWFLVFGLWFGKFWGQQKEKERKKKIVFKETKIPSFFHPFIFSSFHPFILLVLVFQSTSNFFFLKFNYFEEREMMEEGERKSKEEKKEHNPK